MKTPFCVVLICLVNIWCLSIPVVEAQDLTINDGGTVVVNGGSLVMNCETITVKNGGTLTVNSGEIDQCRRIAVEAGGTFTNVAGTILMCYGFLPSIYELMLLSQ